MNRLSIFGINFHRRRLSNYSLLIFLLGGLLITSLLLYVYYQINVDYERTIEETTRENMNLTIAFEEDQRKIIATADRDLLKLKQAYERDGIFSPVVAEYFEGKDDNISYDQVAIYDEQGLLSGSFIKDIPVMNGSDKVYFQVPRDSNTNTLFIGPPINPKMLEKSIIPLSRRINKPDGSFGGIVYMGLKAGRFIEFSKKMELSLDQVIMLIGMDGIMRIRGSNDTIGAGQDYKGGSPIWNNIQTGRPSGTYFGRGLLDGIQRVTSYRVMRDYPLAVAVGKSTQSTLVNYERRKVGYILGAFLSSLFILLFCGLLVNRMKKQLDLNARIREQSQLLEIAQDYIMVRDLESRIIYWNQGAEKGYGYSVAEVVGQVSHEILQTKFPQTADVILAEILTSGQWKGELKHTRKDGVQIIIQSNQTLNLDENGNPVSILEINHDITEKKKAEEIMCELNLKLQIFNTELENTVAERTIELQSINATLEEEIMERQMSQESLSKLNCELTDMNVALEEEIMERQLAEQSLQETQAILQAALDNCQAGIAVVDAPDGKLRYLNKVGQLITNCSEENFNTGVTNYLMNWNIFREDGTPFANHEIPLVRAIRYGENYSDEFTIMCENGKNLEIWANAAPIRDEGGNIKGGIIIFLDISERKRIEASLIKAKEEAERATIAKSNFLANMSHEIRTPMNGIIGMTDITLMTNLEEKQKEYLNIVKSSTMALLRVLNDILDYSKIEAGKVELEETLFDIWETTNEVVDLFTIAAKQKGLCIKLNIDKEIPHTVLGDSVRLRQVLSNLVGNGIKFTAQGEIVIYIAIEEKSKEKVKLRFVVTDTGIGIPDEKLDKLFKRFSQIDDSHTKQFGGTGLGLAISQKLIEIMDGEIGVESKEGVGSRFFFTAVFGLHETVQRSNNESIQQECIIGENAEIKKILLVEDDLVSRNMIKIILDKNNFQVIAVENGEEAISACEKQQFDIILMDINMPYLDGYSATKIIRMKEKDTTHRTPILAMTAYALKGDREKCLAAGMDDYISKPIELRNLIELINKWLIK